MIVVVLVVVVVVVVVVPPLPPVALSAVTERPNHYYHRHLLGDQGPSEAGGRAVLAELRGLGAARVRQQHGERRLGLVGVPA